MTAEETLAEVTGYLGPGSAVGRYRQAPGRTPSTSSATPPAAAWGAAATGRRVTWPMTSTVRALPGPGRGVGRRRAVRAAAPPAGTPARRADVRG